MLSLSSKTPMRRDGRRTKAWEAARRKLKCQFVSMGIDTCELQFPGCAYDNELGFAHRYKRRFITTEEELHVVILACSRCHDVIELQGHAMMKKIVDSVIAKRD